MCSASPLCKGLHGFVNFFCLTQNFHQELRSYLPVPFSNILDNLGKIISNREFHNCILCRACVK